jgi:hypothetical protein
MRLLRILISGAEEIIGRDTWDPIARKRSVSRCVSFFSVSVSKSAQGFGDETPVLTKISR